MARSGEHLVVRILVQLSVQSFCATLGVHSLTLHKLPQRRQPQGALYGSFSSSDIAHDYQMLHLFTRRTNFACVFRTRRVR